jgi:hypothetical protein
MRDEYIETTKECYAGERAMRNGLIALLGSKDSFIKDFNDFALTHLDQLYTVLQSNCKRKVCSYQIGKTQLKKNESLSAVLSQAYYDSHHLLKLPLKKHQDIIKQLDKSLLGTLEVKLPIKKTNPKTLLFRAAIEHYQLNVLTPSGLLAGYLKKHGGEKKLSETFSSLLGNFQSNYEDLQCDERRQLDLLDYAKDFNENYTTQGFQQFNQLLKRTDIVSEKALIQELKGTEFFNLFHDAYNETILTDIRVGKNISKVLSASSIENMMFRVCPVPNFTQEPYDQLDTEVELKKSRADLLSSVEHWARLGDANRQMLTQINAAKTSFREKLSSKNKELQTEIGKGNAKSYQYWGEVYGLINQQPQQDWSSYFKFGLNTYGKRMKGYLTESVNTYAPECPNVRLASFCPRTYLQTVFAPLFKYNKQIDAQRKANDKLKKQVDHSMGAARNWLNEKIDRLNEKIKQVRLLEIRQKTNDLRKVLQDGGFSTLMSASEGYAEGFEAKFPKKYWHVTQCYEIHSAMQRFNSMHHVAISCAKLLDQIQEKLVADRYNVATYDEKYKELVTAPNTNLKRRLSGSYEGTLNFIGGRVQQLNDKLSHHNQAQAESIVASCDVEIGRLNTQLQKAEGIRGQEGLSKNQQAQSVLDTVCNEFEKKKNDLLLIKEDVSKNQNLADYTLIQKFDNYSRQIMGASSDLKNFCIAQQLTLKTNVTYGRKVWEWLRAFITFGMVKSRRYKTGRLLTEAATLFAHRNDPMSINGGNIVPCIA